MKFNKIYLFSAFILVSCRTPETSSTKVTERTVQQCKMEYTEICKSTDDCKKFSKLVLGTDHLVHSNWVFNGQPEINQQRFNEILDFAVKRGINTFDTSHIYSGNVENKLGNYLRDRKEQIKDPNFYISASCNPDRNLYVITKGGFPFDLTWSQYLEKGTHSPELIQTLILQQKLPNGFVHNETNGSPLQNIGPGTYSSRLYGDKNQIVERVKEEINWANGNLNPTSITIYLMHRDDGDYYDFKKISRQQTPVKTIMSALNDPRIKDNYWAVGWSNWQTQRIDESMEIFNQDRNFVPPVINSPYFSLFEMHPNISIHAGGVQVTHEEMMNENFQKGIKIMPYSPLGGFSILDKPNPWIDGKNSAFEKMQNNDLYWRNVYNSIFTPENELRFRNLEHFISTFNSSHGTNYTLDQMMNAYVLAHPRTDLLAIGPLNEEQIQRTIDSLLLSKKLSHLDLKFLYYGKK